MAEENVGGTVVRGEDGALYFIRDEVLEQCKIEEPEMSEFCEKLLEREGDVEGYSISTGPIARAISFQGAFKLANPFGSRAASTVMCPGVMKDAAIRIRTTRRGR